MEEPLKVGLAPAADSNLWETGARGAALWLKIVLYCLKLAGPTVAFYCKIYELLREYCGSSIHELGDIELNYALSRFAIQ